MMTGDVADFLRQTERLVYVVLSGNVSEDDHGRLVALA